MKVFCNDCLFFPEGLRDENHPPMELKKIANCQLYYINYATGENYRKKCVEKNKNGDCTDFKNKKGEENV
jgi:hypothetical protein